MNFLRTGLGIGTSYPMILKKSLILKALSNISKVFEHMPVTNYILLILYYINVTFLYMNMLLHMFYELNIFNL